MLQQRQEPDLHTVDTLQTTDQQEEQASSLTHVPTPSETALAVLKNPSLLTHTESSESEVHAAVFSKTVQKNILRVRALRRTSGYLTGFSQICMALIVFTALTGIIPSYCLFYFYVPSIINLILCSPLEFWIIRTGKHMARQDDPRLVGPLLDAWRELGRNARLLNVGSQQIETALIRLLPRLTPTDARHLTKENREQLQAFLLYGDSCFSPVQRERTIHLKIAILRALERVGTQEAIGHVSAVATNANDLRLRQAAQECLPYLKARKAESEISLTLLRSASVGDIADPHLLRPTSEVSVPIDDLLRPT